MMLDELIAGLGVRVVRSDGSGVRVCDLTEDSRTIFPGSMFVARRGLCADGRAFVDEAARAGACAVLTDDEAVSCPDGVALCVCEDVALTSAEVAERFYGSPGSQLALIGVTGTNGKTTIAHLVHRMLNRCGIRCGLIGTVVVDDGAEVAPAAMTTPPAIELSRTLATMVETGCRAAVMEISSHALDQKRADGVRFDAAIFTNLTHDHRDYHKSPEQYLAAKKRLFDLLKPEGLGIVNVDDPASDAFGAARLLRCSRTAGDGCDWSVAVERSGLGGMAMTLVGGDECVPAELLAFGSFNALNVLEAFLSAREVIDRLGGVDPERFSNALRGLDLPHGRLTRVSSGPDDIDVFIDFAHTPDALRSVLEALQGVVGAGRRVCVVFGCGGDRDRDKRAEMGKIAAAGADRVIVTSDNPRRESPSAIIEQIVEGMNADGRERAEVFVDRAAAIRKAIVGGESGDVVVIAGKGHEQVQVLPDPGSDAGVVERVFDDREHAVRALGERRNARHGSSEYESFP
jgi:UDP-N-acetylmuramoyl-L-alanyl-D-glutamate--2,6-diaminopimelate ligase